MGKAYTVINTPNVTGYFRPADDQWETRSYLRAASVAAVNDGTMMAIDVSGSSPTGYVIIAGTSNANGKNYVGILQQAILTTDTNYAVDHMVPVRYPTSPNAKMYFTVGAGTFTQADVGRVCLLHTDSKSVNVDGNGLGVIITDYLDSTHGLCMIAPTTVTS